MNIDEILNYKRPKETYYDIIGCAQSSTVEQINREYKIRALQFHPDKNLDDPSCLDRFKLLQTAKDTLTEPNKRKSYDCWLNSRIQIPFEQWQAKKGHSMHWAPPRSSKLSIGHGADNPSGQGSDFKPNNIQAKSQDLLEKFRKYEI